MPPKHHTGITAAVREALQTLNGVFSVDHVVNALGTRVQTYHDKDRVKKAIYEILKTGGIERIEHGLYQTVRTKKAPEIRERMWRILRANRAVTIEDLQELAGAGEAYAKEWLQMLARQGVVRHLKNGRWQMIYDPVEMPRDKEKAEKLRNIRLRKREAVEDALNRAQTAIIEARTALGKMEE